MTIQKPLAKPESFLVLARAMEVDLVRIASLFQVFSSTPEYNSYIYFKISPINMYSFVSILRYIYDFSEISID